MVEKKRVAEKVWNALLTLVARHHGMFVDWISIAKPGVYDVNVRLRRPEYLEIIGFVKEVFKSTARNAYQSWNVRAAESWGNLAL